MAQAGLRVPASGARVTLIGRYGHAVLEIAGGPGDSAARCWKLLADRNFPHRLRPIQKKRPESPFSSGERLIAGPGLPISFYSVGV
jgi:hypothetical protein